MRDPYIAIDSLDERGVCAMPCSDSYQRVHESYLARRGKQLESDRGCSLVVMVTLTLTLLGVAFLIIWRWWNVRPALFWGWGYLCWAACDLLLLPDFHFPSVRPEILPQALFLTSIFLQMHGLQDRVGEAKFALRTRLALYAGVTMATSWLVLFPYMKWIELSIRLVMRLVLTGIALFAMRPHLNQKVDKLLFAVVVAMTLSIVAVAMPMIHASWLSGGGPISTNIVMVARDVGNVVSIAFSLGIFLAVLLDVTQHHRNEALLDSLTGLANRRQFEAFRNTEWRRAANDRQSLSLLLIDVDQFKAYNDTYGHAAGDRCLIAIARIIRATAQQRGNLCVRLGGEEFAVLIPGARVSDAFLVAEEICLGVRTLSLPHQGNPHGVVTVSIGVAAVVPTSNNEGALFEAADSALYRAKNRGRNRVEEASRGVDAQRQIAGHPSIGRL